MNKDIKNCSFLYSSKILNLSSSYSTLSVLKLTNNKKYNTVINNNY